MPKISKTCSEKYPPSLRQKTLKFILCSDAFSKLASGSIVLLLTCPRGAWGWFPNYYLGGGNILYILYCIVLYKQEQLISKLLSGGQIYIVCIVYIVLYCISQSVIFVWILTRTNIRIYSYEHFCHKRISI